MHLMYFGEEPAPADEWAPAGSAPPQALDPPAPLDDPDAGRRFDERLAEFAWAEACGVEGLMLNRHRHSALCREERCFLLPTLLAGTTGRMQIALLVDPVAAAANPAVVAEDLALLDMIATGRLVAVLVPSLGDPLPQGDDRGVDRERFAEAHDLIRTTWTAPQAFRWEGRHHQLPLVHAQVAPQQKPHPRVWIAGTGEPEMVAWAARRAYPYVCIDTGVEGAQRAGQVYDDAVVAAGHAPGPEHRGYVVRCHVQDTAEKALESARRTGPRGRSMVICGTPEQCVRSLRSVVATLRPGILAIWANAGAVSHADSMRGIELLGTEVMPAVREFARECGVRGPFDGDVPAGRPPAAEA